MDLEAGIALVAPDGGPDSAAEWVFYSGDGAPVPAEEEEAGRAAAAEPATVLTPGADTLPLSPTPQAEEPAPAQAVPRHANDVKRKKHGSKRRGSGGGGGGSGSGVSAGASGGSATGDLGCRPLQHAVPSLRPCLRGAGTAVAGAAPSKSVRFGAAAARVIPRGVGGCGVPSSGGWALALASPWRDAEDR